MSLPNPLDNGLCGIEGCRRLRDHPVSQSHDPWPTSAWSFLHEPDKNKINKAGFATPRGGAKGAYQNHVDRSNQVIVPYERLSSAPLSEYTDGYVVRLFPEQYFADAKSPKAEFLSDTSPVNIGANAFVLYRSHDSFARFPPMDDWIPRHLEKDGVTVLRRGKGVVDVGHYVTRIPRLGATAAVSTGAVQGIFAPEYADREANYLSKCVLAWLIVSTAGSPYTTMQAFHLRRILQYENLFDGSAFEDKGIMQFGIAKCPLCLRLIRYDELHRTVSFEDILGYENAAGQVDEVTRSTIVNLFHLMPLNYDAILHSPSNVAWGHATCNTWLGQRPCRSLHELIELGNKVGIVTEDGIDTFGWISADLQMIRSPLGSVWIRLVGDTGEMTPPDAQVSAGIT